MAASIRVLIAALFALGALSSCVRNPDSAAAQAQAVTGAEPEIVVPRGEYYGRTELEIPGGDGQVVDYANG